MSLRTERIGEQLKSEIAQVLREEVSDPRIPMLTLTRLDVAPDLTNAIVFWSAYDLAGAEQVEVIEEGLECAASFVRRKLASRLDLRRTPELVFRFDPSLEMGSRTLSVLRSLDHVEKE